MNLTIFLALTAVTSNPVDFDTDVVPVLTKAGCNAAACHGAAAGRGGFKLSLFGGDPTSDFHAIVHELEGRRVNLAEPSASLLVLKPTGEMAHKGGIRIEPDSGDAATLASWIEDGALRRQTRQLERVSIMPRDVVVESVPGTVQLKVSANFDDGVQRDVTHHAVYTSTDPAAIKVGDEGKLTVLRRGRHTVIVRYLSEVQTVQVTVPLADKPIDLADEPRKNWIDDEILATLEALRLAPSEQADDATMLRRLRLDLTGRLPSPEEVRQYAADTDPKKYAKLVDRLLAAPEFTEYWTYKFAKLLRIRAQPQESQAARTFHNWVKKQIGEQTSLDKLAVALLTAEGDTHTNGPANFYRVTGDARAQAEYVSELLMGVRLRCANCHNHPLDRWTQDDYHGLAAVFAKIERGRVIKVNSHNEVTHPRTGQPAVPRIPGTRFLDEDDGRQSLARWLVAKENPYFAKAMANRLWKAMMGRGLVEPTDDLRATNPATHPALLERLADDFAANGFDLRQALRLMATSAAYARSVRPTNSNESDDRYYSRMLAKSLEPEVLADALSDVTGVWDKYGGEQIGTRAITLYNPRTPSEALDILGRCSREDSCETAAGAAGGLSTKLHLMNGKLINRKLTAQQGRLRRSLDAGRPVSDLVEEFYLRALSRPPSDREREFWNREIGSAKQPDERRERLEDFVWSLLSCREFGTNH